MPASWSRLGACVLLLSSLSGACDDGGTLTSDQARLVLEPSVVDLGRVYVGQSVEGVVEARSLGAAPVEYTARFGPGFGEGITVGPARAELAPRIFAPVVVRLTPQVSDARELRVFFDYGTQTATLTVLAEVLFPPDCEDGNICTENSFDFERGRCTSRATTDACNDLDACTSRDQCAQAMCLGESISCDDGNTCTDDFCVRDSGCVHIPARDCDDGNPCTNDFCDPVFGCRHETADDGTPCGEGVECRVASICIGGSCSEQNVPDGTQCDDGDPCSGGERCTEGVCLDPDFAYPADGQIEWTTTVGPLAPGAERNPVIDVDGRIFIGVIDGVVALEQCGGVAWERRGIGAPDADSMLLVPGRLVVPLSDRILELDPMDGAVSFEHDLTRLLEGQPSTGAELNGLDLVVRGSGALVGSAWVVPPEGPPFGLVYEIPADGSPPLRLLTLEGEHAPHLALDLDESLVLLLRRGPPGGDAVAVERVARLGPDNLPGTSWTTSEIETQRSGISIDGAGRVVWTAGLRDFARTGEVRVFEREPIDPSDRSTGAAVVDRGRVYFVASDPEDASPDAALLVAYEEGRDDPVFVQAIPSPTLGATPALDGSGNIYVVSDDGVLRSWDFDGALRFALALPFGAARIDNGGVAVTRTNTTLVVGAGRVFGVQADHPQSTSAWFRHRRDNFSTGHR